MSTLWFKRRLYCRSAPWFGRLFTLVVLLACLNDLAARALLDRPGLPPWLPCLAPGVGFLFPFLSLQV